MSMNEKQIQEVMALVDRHAEVYMFGGGKTQRNAIESKLREVQAVPEGYAGAYVKWRADMATVTILFDAMPHAMNFIDHLRATWDKDQRAMLSAAPAQPAQAEQPKAAQPMAGMSTMNRQIAYCAADKLRSLGYEWDGSNWKAAQQEPVAYLHDDGYWTPAKSEAGRQLSERLLFAGSPSIAVYTAAPQREPMTDEQWLELLLREADAETLRIAAIPGESIQTQGRWVLLNAGKKLKSLVERFHHITKEQQ